ncbi:MULTISPECIES: hypothetical protein [Aliivibrio]|uniref:DUF1566 domain-containing protein n=1 Tax=Aliivibrio finisterrensis TaxID=511998 RepID=A0A4Q5KUQ2_9GAMM|nr:MULTISPECIES: hypothetical protein [Aliivibrio]MDD9177762.1 hypothetical protein [Aliivibrio sp. A6]RYU50273.1 hypothetical protein ERW56_15115 [Aliivibrio finisterrensis]RYU51888.1 hypothetical protein ERW57_08220 [Aliivibrio finisterrensis]RYU56000.1 hypothetical protein ERW50_15170 [Aliivibrio finisterrensis]RYU64715.1 hypothetical protein ERW53_08935 [Aliivibrio finisterrensis]
MDKLYSIKRKVTLISCGLLASIPTLSFASNIEIHSFDGSMITAPTLVPIFSKYNGKPTFIYNEEGEINNYIWLDEGENILANGLLYIPSKTDINKDIRLCLVNNESMECSNSLNIHKNKTPITRPAARSTRSSVTPLSIVDYWSLNDKIVSDEVIFDEDTSLTLNTETKYIGSAQADASVIPFIKNMYIFLKNETGVALTSPIELSSYTGPSNKLEDATYTEVITGLNLTNINYISYCSFALSTKGQTPTMNSTNCDSRVVKDKDTNSGKFILPPTEAQFKALFPSDDSYALETVGTTKFALAPRVSPASGDNLLEKYCAAVSPKAKHLTNAELLAFGKDDATFTKDWPGTTNYWTNEDRSDGLFDIPYGWGTTIAISGSEDEYITSNAFYQGFYICKIEAASPVQP